MTPRLKRWLTTRFTQTLFHRQKCLQARIYVQLCHSYRRNDGLPKYLSSFLQVVIEFYTYCQLSKE